MSKLTKQIDAAVWVILVSNIIAGVAFIIAYFLTKEILLLVGGFFVMIAAVAFKLIIQKFTDKIRKYDRE